MMNAEDAAATCVGQRPMIMVADNATACVARTHASHLLAMHLPHDPPYRYQRYPLDMNGQEAGAHWSNTGKRQMVPFMVTR